MKKNRFIAVLMAIALLGTGCGFMKEDVLLANKHGFSKDAAAVSSFTEGKALWAGTELCIPKDTADAEDEAVSAGAALLFHLDKPEAVYAKNVYQEMNPASITTLFTAYVILQSRELSDVVTVTADELANLQHTSTIGLKEGDQLTVEQLLYGMLLCSGVDAANVLAVDTAGSKAGFVRQMNKAAKELGCVDTQFQNANGLTEWGHYTTAYDIYLVVHKLIEDERFMKIISQDAFKAEYRNAEGGVCEETYLSTVRYKEQGITRLGSLNVIGGKTGTTSSAGHCLALILNSDSGDRYLALVLKAKSRDSLYEQIEHIVKKN
ncbi:MAG: serine hydrolase [Lachnospiraceae bacterium]|nr:serine hydrolase [Lachnospiraceae bacterium]